MKSMLRACAALPTLLILGSSHGDFLLITTEVEPNDSLLTAQDFAPFPPQSMGRFGLLSVESSLPAGDVDFFQVHFPQMVQFSVSAEALGPNPNLLAVFNTTGSMLYFTNEGGMIELLNPGTYIFAVSAGEDTGFVGNHTQSFEYTLQLGWVVIPAPSALAILGIAGLLGRSRRRKR